MRLAGVSALTLTPNLLEALTAAHEPEAALAERSMFAGKATKVSEHSMERLSYIDYESKFRSAFNNGKGQVQTIQVFIHDLN